jgi:hypothetical protein
MLKLISAVVLSLGSFALVGCQSGAGGGSGGASTHGTTAMHTGSADMACNKCGSIAMKTPVLNDKGHPIPGRYKTVEQTKAGVCADCAKMAHEGSMKVGDSMHCNTCGGDVKVVAGAQR